MNTSETSAIPIVVLTRQQDHVEYINRILRNAGHAVHCHWAKQLSDLNEALAGPNVHMIFGVVSSDDEFDPATLLQATRQLAPRAPTLLVREQINEETLTHDIQIGARDVVSLNHPERLQAVFARELRSFRLERRLGIALHASHQYHEQIKELIAGSIDAIVLVQEGIMTNPNTAWMKLLGYSSLDDLEGLPILDCIAPDSHNALKGALAACLQGKWVDHTLKINVLLANSQSVPIELLLHKIDIEGEPGVQLKIASHAQDERPLETRMEDAFSRDVTTGFLQWHFFIEQLRTRLAQSIKGGIRSFVRLELENFPDVLATLGPTTIESCIAHFVKPIKEQLQPNDLVGRFGNSKIFVLLERGTQDDVVAWCNNALRRINEQPFVQDQQSIVLNGASGIAPIHSTEVDINQLIQSTLYGARDFATTQLIDTLTADAGLSLATDQNVSEETLAADQEWVDLIKSSLMQNRFHLLEQPIITLGGEDQGMCDVLVRMQDEANNEILPSQFIAIAERNGLMKTIDRWVINAALSFCSSNPDSTLFVRLSKDSVQDSSLPTWLKTQAQSQSIKPNQIVFEISESVASQYLPAATTLAQQLKQSGFRFSIEHAGRSPDSATLLQQLPLDYLKLDGTLIQTLATDPKTQETIASLVLAAKKHNISTIAERVEDANTMAVLWQLGVHYIQGYFVREPERLTLE